MEYLTIGRQSQESLQNASAGSSNVTVRETGFVVAASTGRAAPADEIEVLDLAAALEVKPYNPYLSVPELPLLPSAVASTFKPRTLYDTKTINAPRYPDRAAKANRAAQLKLDGYLQAQYFEACLHSYILVAWQNVVDKCKDEAFQAKLRDGGEKEIMNWLEFVSMWPRHLYRHRDYEEMVLFPGLEKNGLFCDVSTVGYAANDHTLSEIFFHTSQDQEDEHRELARELTKLQATITHQRLNHGRAYNPVRLCEAFEAVLPVVAPHMREEVEVLLDPVNLAVHLSSAEMQTLLAEFADRAKKEADPFYELPYILGHIEPEHKFWMGLPWHVQSVLVPGVFGMRHRRLWKYLPHGYTV